MERNRWETAIRCLEVAVHPGTGDDEVIAAVNGFRRTAEGVPLSQVCLEYACGGLPLAELARFKETIDRLNRENLELRRKLAVEEAAQSATARRLDEACRRIFELTEEAAASQRVAEAIEREFEEFRAAYAKAIDEGRLAAAAHLLMLKATAGQEASGTRRPFSAFLAEARLAADRAAAAVGGGNGTGRRPANDPGQPWTA